MRCKYKLPLARLLERLQHLSQKILKHTGIQLIYGYRARLLIVRIYYQTEHRHDLADTVGLVPEWHVHSSVRRSLLIVEHTHVRLISAGHYLHHMSHTAILHEGRRQLVKINIKSRNYLAEDYVYILKLALYLAEDYLRHDVRHIRLQKEFTALCV